ncbi:patatin-like phospholipase family protein [Algoriphagus sp. AK58]|uniref:patatin-like phospholipase family protein n=1 Tax=Algoriphagus sp. AK58 TaxID=1406877 RepID=UPI001650B889|nr:patatin-like phospholipase family protein [Algoriphagus sp. AK58]MBC6365705.1 phospholipase [Algoriphagus sp. AK58]
MSKKKTVSLVLSSGGARGLAHVGVIEELEKRGYEIIEIAGCSAGALVGGMYATGKMPEFKEWICNLDRVDVFSLMDFTFSSRGFIKGEKVYSALKKVVPDCQIEDLPIQFSCNAVEVHSGKEYVFRKGSLYKAIRASGSIPSVFLPAKIEKNHFIDGGVLNPVPISLISDPAKSLVVVVDVNGLENEFISPPKKDESGKQLITLPGWLKEYQSKMRQFFPEEKKAESKTAYSSLELVTRSFDLLQDRFCELLLEKYPVDVKIKISRKQAGTLEFHRSAEMIEIGRLKAKEALDQLEHGNQ